jgi:DNA-binding NtrC family response regulator
MIMILIIEDDVASLESYVLVVEEIIEKLGFTVDINTATTFEEADIKLSELNQEFDGLILVDMALPRGGWEDVLAGYKLVQKYQALLPQAKWVAMTSRIDMRGTILESGMSVFEELYRLGLFGLWKKDEPEKLQTLIQRYFSPKPSLQTPFYTEKLSNNAIFVTQYDEIVSEIMSAAIVDRGILLFGERGTGKSLTAELIHKKSKRSENGFAGIDGEREDIELVLFGQDDETPFWLREDSIFRGIIGGSLYIKNINLVPPYIQRKLWTYLVNINKVNCRLFGGIDITRKTFRDDGSINRDFLDEFYAFELPNLENRSEDIPFLIQIFVEQFNHETQLNKEIIEIDKISKAISMLNFPTNIAGLRRFINDLLMKSTISVVAYDDAISLIELGGYYFEKVSPGKNNVVENIMNDQDDDNIPTIHVTAEDVEKIRRKMQN